jgi:hypothetical protein
MFGAVCLALLAPPLHADDAVLAKRRLKTVTRIATVAQCGANRVEAAGAAITDEPFTFAKVGRLRRIDQVRITVSLGDAETGPGDSDEHLLRLALDGIDTGILLDGFEENVVDTRTIRGVPDNGAQILSALKVDGRLAATIVAPAGPTGNLVDVPADFVATLALTGKQKRKHR